MRPLRVLAVVSASAAAIGLGWAVAQEDGDDAGFAADLWNQLAAQRLVGPDALGAVPYARQGQAHGETLVSLVSTVTVGGETGVVIVKRSYAEDATREGILADPQADLMDVTVMFQRAGYDPDNGDWFWSMYAPDGMVGAMEGMTMAGRVEMCSGCHAAAPGDDYVFLFDGVGGM